MNLTTGVDDIVAWLNAQSGTTTDASHDSEFSLPIEGQTLGFFHNSLQGAAVVTLSAQRPASSTEETRAFRERLLRETFDSRFTSGLTGSIDPARREILSRSFDEFPLSEDDFNQAIDTLATRLNELDFETRSIDEQPVPAIEDPSYLWIKP